VWAPRPHGPVRGVGHQPVTRPTTVKQTTFL
jgi:hypothetical protein